MRLGQTHVLGNRGIGLTGGDTQDDLRAVGILLGRSAGGHAALQFRALGRQQPNSTATLRKGVQFSHRSRIH